MKRFMKILSGFLFVVFMSGCALGVEGGESSSTVLNNIDSVKERSVLKNFAYSGGSMLYNPSDISTSHLAKGVIVATRAGLLLKTDLGNGEYSIEDPIYAASFGYIEIKEISTDSVTFDYYVSDGWKEDEEVPVKKGTYTLEEGKSVDLTGSGTPDLKYVKPSVKRAGSEKAMWLTTVNDPENTSKSFMFSILPDQYVNKAYPGGLLSINEDGRYVVNKYDVGTTSRAAVKSISYGDYVIDNENNAFQVYVGDSRFAQARAVEDSELKVLDIENSDDYETYLFKAEEFGSSYSVQKLFENLPASLVSVDYNSMTTSNLIEELNKLVVDSSLCSVLISGNDSDIANEIRENIAELDFSSVLQTVVINRIVLAKMYPDNCPGFSVLSKSFEQVFPTFSLFLGCMAEDPEETTSTNVENSLVTALPVGHTRTDFLKSARWNRKFQLYVPKTDVKSYDPNADLDPDYVSYKEKRDKLLNEFNSLIFTFDLMKLANHFINSNILNNFMRSGNIVAEIGVGGGISVNSRKAKLEVKVYILGMFEIEDGLSYSFMDSLFTEEEPFYIHPTDGAAVTKDDMAANNWSKERQKEEIAKQDKALVENLGAGNNWILDCFYNNPKTLEPTQKALKIKHFSKALVQPYPVVFTFDASFDILMKTTVSIKFKNVYVGGLFLAGIKADAGITWDYVRLFSVPIWIKNASTFGNCDFVKDGAFYAGLKTKSSGSVEVGGLASVSIIPVADVRAGVGLGQTIGIADADVTVGPVLKIALPFTGTLGFSFKPFAENEENCGFNVTKEFEADLNVNLSVDARAHVGFLKWRKDWKWNIYNLTSFEMTLVKFSSEEDPTYFKVTRTPFNL